MTKANCCAPKSRKKLIASLRAITRCLQRTYGRNDPVTLATTSSVAVWQCGSVAGYMSKRVRIQTCSRNFHVTLPTASRVCLSRSAYDHVHGGRNGYGIVLGLASKETTLLHSRVTCNVLDMHGCIYGTESDWHDGRPFCFD